MYEMATKELPFNGDTPVSVALKQLRDIVPDPKKINTSLSSGFISVMKKATSKDLNQRYQSVFDMMDDLKKLSVNKNFIVNTEGYLSDETMILPSLSEEEIMQHEQRKKQSRPAAKKKAAPVSKLNVTLVIVGALIISLLIFSVMAFNRFEDIFNVKIVTVPDVVGKSVDEAVRDIQDVGLIADTTERRFTNDIAEDVVVSQNYNPGEELKEGFTVKLVVSNGAIQAIIPNVVQQDITKAKVMIENEKFEVGDITYTFGDLPS